MLISTGLEILGLGLILPVISLVLEPDIIQKYPDFRFVLDTFNFSNQNDLIIFSMILLLVIYVFKNSFISYFTWFQFKFVNLVQVDLSTKLYSIYLNKSYSFHIEENSSRLIRNILSEVTNFQNSLLQIIILITEVTLIFSIFIFLLFIEPFGILVATILMGFASWIFYQFSKKMTEKWGRERIIHTALMTKHLMQGFGALKDIKILGRERNFIREFNSESFKSSQSNRFNSFVGALPRLYLELFAIAGLVLIVTIMVTRDISNDFIIKVVGLFSISAFKLIPSIYKCLYSLQYIRFVKPSVDMLYFEFQNQENLFVSMVDDTRNYLNINSFENSISIQNLHFSYPNTRKNILKNINLVIKKNTSIGIIGPSGSGKSTFIDLIIGLLKPTSGFIFMDDLDINSSLSSQRMFMNNIGYVPQNLYLIDDTLRRNIALGIPDDLIIEDNILRSIDLACLGSFINDLPSGLDTIVGERGVKLSGGQKQRIGLARALYHNPSILVLDEATSALDNETEKEVMRTINKMKDKTIVIIAHRLSTVENCDFIYKIQNGKIILQK